MVQGGKVDLGWVIGMDLNAAALAGGKVDLKRVVVDDKTEDIPYD